MAPHALYPNAAVATFPFKVAPGATSSTGKLQGGHTAAPAGRLPAKPYSPGVGSSALKAAAHRLDCFGGDAAALIFYVLELKFSARAPHSRAQNLRPFTRHSHKCRRCLCWFTPSPSALTNAERYGKPVNNCYLCRTPDPSSPAPITTTRSRDPVLRTEGG